ncbi:MAG: hypothetical protein ACFN3C_07260, partial [Stomatobaculum longum]
MLNKKTVDDLKDLKGKKVLVRCDFNVPLIQPSAAFRKTAPFLIPFGGMLVESEEIIMFQLSPPLTVVYSP